MANKPKQPKNIYKGDLNTAEVKEVLGYSENHLRFMRTNDNGPQFYHTETGLVRYKFKDVIAWARATKDNKRFPWI